MKKIFEKINFRQPKYMLPAILYIPLLGASYFIFDLFNAEKAEIADKTLQTTEFLNPDLPDATIKGGDGIGSKYENMAKSWGKIADYTAVDNIERDEPDDDKEKYESQYSQDELPSWVTGTAEITGRGSYQCQSERAGSPQRTGACPRGSTTKGAGTGGAC